MFSTARSAAHLSGRNPLSRFGPSLGQLRMTPGPEELIQRAGSWCKVSVWDGETEQVLPGALVEARRMDGVPGVARDTTGVIGVAILRFPDAPIGTPVSVKVSAKGYASRTIQLETISRFEAADDFNQGAIVDLRRAPVLEAIAITTAVGALLWWGLF